MSDASAQPRHIGRYEIIGKFAHGGIAGLFVARLPEGSRASPTAQLLDSLEQPLGISIEDEDEIRRRAQQARDGVPGVPWSEVKRSLVK